MTALPNYKVNGLSQSQPASTKKWHTWKKKLTFHIYHKNKIKHWKTSRGHVVFSSPSCSPKQNHLYLKHFSQMLFRFFSDLFSEAYSISLPVLVCILALLYPTVRKVCISFSGGYPASSLLKC